MRGCDQAGDLTTTSTNGATIWLKIWLDGNACKTAAEQLNPANFASRALSKRLGEEKGTSEFSPNFTLQTVR